MSEDSAPAGQPSDRLPDQPAPGVAAPGLLELFLAFARMSLAGFGGVLVFARRAIVEQHRWMTADEFNETFALCHFLPGPNIVNLSMVFGSRLRGIAGGIAAFAGLLLPPTLIMMVLAIIYARVGDLDVLRRSLAGISCAAVGLLIAVVFRMMTPLLKRTDPLALILMLGVFLAIGVLRLPLQAVLLVAIPVSIGATYFLRRKVAA
jgi:chromate transporter